MPNIELIDKNKKGPPTVICPYCKRKMIFSIDMFKNNITKIVESKCPYCSGKTFTCILILTTTTMQRLMNQINRIISTARGESNIIKM